MAFNGFSAETFDFLVDLEAHNERAWFAENRERYERVLLGPQREFVDAVGAAFAAVDQRVHAVPEVNASIYRIYRDVRFSKDKSPYKTYSDMWFWLGDEKKFSAGYFVRIAPDSVWVGGGQHQLTDAQLGRYRRAVDDGITGQWLARIADDVAVAGFEMGDATLKRVPVGFSAQSPRAELLKFTRIHAIAKVSPPPAEALSAEFVGWCMDRFQRVKPLVDWLAEQIGGAEAPDERL